MGYQKLHMGDYKFFHRVKALLDQCHVNNTLLKLRQTNPHKGKRRKGNRDNVYRPTACCGIPNARQWGTQELVKAYKAFKVETKCHLDQSLWMRCQYLKDKI